MNILNTGSCVMTTDHNFVGTITRMFDDFSAVAASGAIGDATIWLNEQEIPIDEDSKTVRWLRVRCDDGGSILCPESRLLPYVRPENPA